MSRTAGFNTIMRMSLILNISAWLSKCFIFNNLAWHYM